MGTVLTVTVVADDDATARDLAAAAVAEARRWDDILTTWRPAGELARLNARAGGAPVEVSADLAAALRSMRTLSAATGGAFDPAVGPLVDRWRGPRPPVPPPAASDATRIATALRLDGRHAALVAGAALDAGGIGKGIALDAMATLLRRRGVRAAFLDFGGSSQLAIAAPEADAAGWRVAIGGLAPGSVLGEIALRDAALSTSRASEGPTPAGPIVDPRSGVPVFSPRIATARATDATSAEAWTKALIVDGRAALAAARAHGVDALVEDHDGVVTDGLDVTHGGAQRSIEHR
ncbi:MAG TPA: FAD:protein FMN transferase [Candidatus Dormibacteraeota bacterium]|nr:FAD:protein FMN transferase [Candidatus Dormibacteraeota bacterium]